MSFSMIFDLAPRGGPVGNRPRETLGDRGTEPYIGAGAAEKQSGRLGGRFVGARTYLDNWPQASGGRPCRPVCPVTLRSFSHEAGRTERRWTQSSSQFAEKPPTARARNSARPNSTPRNLWRRRPRRA